MARIDFLLLFSLLGLSAAAPLMTTPTPGATDGLQAHWQRAVDNSNNKDQTQSILPRDPGKGGANGAEGKKKKGGKRSVPGVGNTDNSSEPTLQLSKREPDPEPKGKGKKGGKRSVDADSASEPILSARDPKGKGKKGGK